MRLELDFNPQGRYRIKSYSAGSIVISDREFRNNLIVSPDSIFEDRLPAAMENLSPDDLDNILSLDPEVVILGTGATLRFPEQAVMRYFTTRNIGFEVMDTGAACRAYNILMADDRRVVAALFMIRTQAG
jgi:uncharacterized protein